ncbi:MAG: magnesium transporter [Thermoanaerobaculia bacterium]|jgi:magnesium transporter
MADVLDVERDELEREEQQKRFDRLAELVRERKFVELREELMKLDVADLADAIVELSTEDEAVIFRLLPRETATETFEYLPLETQEELLKAMGDIEVANILNDMSADDRTALLEELPAKVTRGVLNLLSPEERRIASQLLGYPESSIGRLMTPDYVAVKQHWTVEQVLAHIRRFGRDRETLDVVYVLDEHGVLIDDIRIRELLLVDPSTQVGEISDRHYIALHATDDQEMAVALFRKHDRVAFPVIDAAGFLLGIVTVDDVLDVAEDEATEDIQKLGGSAALDEPYLDIHILSLIRKRAPWLAILMVSEMLTATAMSYFEQELASAIVLAIFIPLIISSGGNSGSQAATLVTRAMALGEVSLADWWRVVYRELLAGAAMGSFLGVIGFFRVIVWANVFHVYGPHWFHLGVTIGLSLVGVVVWGCLAGSTLPLVLKKLGADPATSSAPFVATLVDVTGIVIYFTVASMVLGGKLL